MSYTEDQARIPKDMQAFLGYCLSTEGAISFEEALSTLHHDAGGILSSKTCMAPRTTGYADKYYAMMKTKFKAGPCYDGLIMVESPIKPEERDDSVSHEAMYRAIQELLARGLPIPEAFSECGVWVVPDLDAKRYYDEQVTFAEKAGLTYNLAQRLDHLAGRNQHYPAGVRKPCRVILTKDFAPHSFQFREERLLDASKGWQGRLSGGLIYSGPEQPLDGSAPAFTVAVDGPRHGWSIHT